MSGEERRKILRRFRAGESAQAIAESMGLRIGDVRLTIRIDAAAQKLRSPDGPGRPPRRRVIASQDDRGPVSEKLSAPFLQFLVFAIDDRLKPVGDVTGVRFGQLFHFLPCSWGNA